MKIYKRKFQFIKKDTILDSILNTFVSILIINWVFQGIRGMQTKEILFRIIFELSIIILLNLNMNSLLLSILMTHTLFFLFNCQFWLICRYSFLYKNNLKHLNLTSKKIIKKIKENHLIKECVIIGSLGSGSNFINVNSDLDIRFFFNKGFIDFFNKNIFLTFLRIYSFINKFSLDLYCYDNIEILNSFNQKEEIRIIKDTDKNLKNFINEKK